jgi:hypothetical protein
MKERRNDFVQNTLLQKEQLTASDTILKYLEGELFQ